MNRLYFYGIAGADDNYRIITHSYVDYATVPELGRFIRNEAVWMRHAYPGIKEVYMIDGSCRLGAIYMDTMIRNSMEKNVEFKRILETEGSLIII